MSTENSNGKLILSAAIVAAVVIAGAMMYKPGTRPVAVVPPNPATDVDDDAILGNPAAPVTMIIFGDYECPFCKRAADTAELQIRKDYVDTGKVRMVFRDYPLGGHPNAEPAAQAAQCAHPQGKYWEYHDALFDRQAELGALDYVALAGDLKLDTVTFKACLDAGTYADEVEFDRLAGEALGVEGTPATFINGRLISGAYPYANYKKVIDEELNK